MLEVSKIIYEIISTSAVFQKYIDKRIYPVVVGQGIAYPFSIYNMYDSTPTKDGEEFEVTLNTYFSPNKVLEAMTFADKAKDEIDNYFIYLASGIDYIDKDQSIVVTINFKIII